MQLIKCPVDPCPKGELWDSAFEIKQHMEENHPDYTWDRVNGELVTERVDADAVIAAMNEAYPEGYTFADWANHYMSGSFQEVFADIFQEAFDLLVARQRKYGVANIENQGLYGIFTRLRDDKMSRIAKAMAGTIVNGRVQLEVIEGDEEKDTFEDALIDVANYALIMLALHRGKWGAPLEEEL